MSTINLPNYTGTIGNLTVNGTIAPSAATNNTCVGIGEGALSNYTGVGNDIGIGINALTYCTTANNIAIGASAGGAPNGGTVCIGTEAGESNCGTFSVCIGKLAGATNCGSSSIVMNASGALSSPTANNTILLNATSAGINPTTSGLFAAPLAGLTGTSLTPASSVAGYGMLVYNPTTSQIEYIIS